MAKRAWRRRGSVGYGPLADASQLNVWLREPLLGDVQFAGEHHPPHGCELQFAALDPAEFCLIEPLVQQVALQSNLRLAAELTGDADSGA